MAAPPTQRFRRRRRAPTVWLACGAVLAMAVVASVLGLRHTSSASRPTGGSLTITLMPRLGPTPGVAVFMELGGAAARGVTGLGLAPAALTGSHGVESLRHLLVKDRGGMILIREGGRDGSFRFARPSEGDWLRVSYLAESSEVMSHVDVQVDAHGVRAVGYSLLALPALRAPVEVDLHWDMHALPVRAMATSFGSGARVHARATAFELAHAMYVAGPLRIYPGAAGQRMIVWGQTAFPPAAALEIYSRALGAAGALFEPVAPRPRHALFVFAQPAMGGRQDGLAFPGTAAIWTDVQHPLDARLRLLIGHEVVHHWIGGHVRLRRPDGSDASWFSEGLAVYYARKLLLATGIISPTAFAADVERDLAAERIDVASGSRAAGRTAWQRRPLSARSHLAPPYHRGALYGARVAALLRARGGAGIDDVMRGLVASAARAGGTLPEQAWVDRLTPLLGPGVQLEIDTSVRSAKAPITLPRGTFGPCFEGEATTGMFDRAHAHWRPVTAPSCPPPGEP